MKMKKVYRTELEGMQDFYSVAEQEFGCKKPDYACNTDGRINACLIEFKLAKREEAADQGKRYIESFNSVAKPIPSQTLAIYINERTYDLYDNSAVCKGGGLKHLKSGTWKTPKAFEVIFSNQNFLSGWINEYSIIAYNDKYFKETKGKAKRKEAKGNFIEELRHPSVLNIIPYTWDDTGDMERSILDCLGPEALKKRLGAFFTPDQYVQISTEYLKHAISDVKTKDYIILDRCAGTGNLEKFLTNEVLSHCILNTYDYSEWTTLKGLYEGRARLIIPHSKDSKDEQGLLSDGDALSEQFINNAEIKKYVDDPDCTVIMLENPPYNEVQAEAIRGGNVPKDNPKSFVKLAMEGSASNDLTNQFIWSGFTYYHPDDYIVFSPIKYWKSQSIVSPIFVEGYICNRKKFHATESGITLIYWKNIKGNIKSIILDSDNGKRTVKHLTTPTHTSTMQSIKQSKECGKKVLCLVGNGSVIPSFMHSDLRNEETALKHFSYVHATKENLLISLVLWASNFYYHKDYSTKDIVMKSADGGTAYQSDTDFLNDCLFWSCLTNKNKCISNKKLRNELCLNQRTVADELFIPNGDGRHTDLVQQWESILSLAATCREFHPKWTYGLSQIEKEINIRVDTGFFNKKGEPTKKWKYPILHGQITEFKRGLKSFYIKWIEPKLFKYELLK